MGGGTPSYTSVSQPSYGEGMREALEAQVALLTGSKVGEDGADFRGIRDELGLEEGSNLMEELVRRYEAPLRKTTAQIDTDVLRQTIIGDETRSTYTDDGRIIEGYETPSGPSGEGTYRLELTESGTVEGRPDLGREGYRLINDKGMTVLEKSTSRFDNKQYQTRDRIEDAFKEEAIEKGFIRDSQQWTDITSSDFPDKYLINPESGKLQESQPVYRKNEDGTDFVAEPGTFEAGETIRSGTGMVDLLGDTRQLEGQDRQAGFDESGQFLGLSALAEDIGRAGQQRAREADIADVERFGGRATEAYRAQGDLGGALETARAMGAGGSEGMSAIPSDPLFEGTATGNLADRARAENLGISAISGGRMGDYDPLALAPAPVEDFRASIEPSAPMVEYQPPRSPTPTISAPRRTDAAQTAGGFQGLVQPGQPALGTPATAQPQQAQYAQPGGTDAFRSALMQQGMGALDQGITARESRAIQEAARARATNMGRTFDQTASIKEAEDVIREDNARRMQNRAFAQSALGQEVGIQQADLARGLQAQQLEMARQTAGADRQLTAEEKDIERAMRRGAMEEQFRQSGLGAERASAAQMVGLEQATSADPFQAILQRQGQNNLGAGGQLFGSAQYGLQSGPQYLNPESGLGFISNQATNAANMFNAQQAAGATRQAGLFGGLGSIAGGFLGNTGLFT